MPSNYKEIALGLVKLGIHNMGILEFILFFFLCMADNARVGNRAVERYVC